MFLVLEQDGERDMTHYKRLWVMIFFVMPMMSFSLALAFKFASLLLLWRSYKSSLSQRPHQLVGTMINAFLNVFLCPLHNYLQGPFLLVKIACKSKPNDGKPVNYLLFVKLLDFSFFQPVNFCILLVKDFHNTQNVEIKLTDCLHEGHTFKHTHTQKASCV